LHAGERGGGLDLHRQQDALASVRAADGQRHLHLGVAREGQIQAKTAEKKLFHSGLRVQDILGIGTDTRVLVDTKAQRDCGGIVGKRVCGDMHHDVRGERISILGSRYYGDWHITQEVLPAQGEVLNIISVRHQRNIHCRQS